MPMADDRMHSSNGRAAHEHRSDSVELARPQRGAPTPRRLARDAAGRHAAAVCDEIDRNQQKLIRLREELEGAAAVCRALLDDSSSQEDVDRLARAERILSDTAE